MRNFVHALVPIALALAFTACDGGGGSADLSGTVTPSGPAPQWYTASGTECGSSPTPGCDYYYAGSALVQINVYIDPFYIGGEGEETDFWISPDGIEYSGGVALNSLDPARGKDAITNGAAARKVALEDSARRLEAKYSLDANTAGKAVSAMSEWVEMGRSRRRTPADIAAFVQRLSGLDMGDVGTAFSAIQSGDEKGYDDALNKAARNWSANPDTMKHILQDWFTQQVAAQTLRNR